MDKQKVYVITEDIDSEEGAVIAVVDDINKCKPAMINYIKHFYNDTVIKDVIDYNLILDESYREETSTSLNVYLGKIRMSQETNIEKQIYEDILEEFIVYETYINCMFLKDIEL